MNNNRFFVILLLGSAAVVSFAVGGILPFLALHRVIPEGEIVRNESRLREEGFDALDSEGTQTLLDDLSARYLQGVADRLGDDFDQGFYQNVVETGRERLAETVYPPEVSDESTALLTRLGRELESPEIFGDVETGENDAAMEEALAFLTELRAGDAEDGNLSAPIEKSQSGRTLDFPYLPIQSWTGNPLNELRWGPSFDRERSVTPRFIASTQSMTQWASLSHLCGWLFTLLTLAVATTQSDGVFPTLFGFAAWDLRLFFRRITGGLLFLVRTLLGFAFSWQAAGATYWKRSIGGDNGESDALLEKKTVVLRL